MVLFKKNSMNSMYCCIDRCVYFFTSRFSAKSSVRYVRKLAAYASVGALMGLSACSSMTHTQKNTALGSAAGGAIGYIVTGGPVGTIGGAVVGGVLGAKK